MVKLLVSPRNKEDLTALKAIFRAMKIPFTEEKSPYDPDFVNKIKESEECLRANRVTKIEPSDMWTKECVKENRNALK